ncbi:WhiB family transcriptional regulator [Nocardia sp. NPDC004604]|uniref:WhiB family transcriptional regulator n=1 Tax=Nocardia sp. NPDC004604 TaxID=3157013 RepID=UPI0033B228E4
MTGVRPRAVGELGLLADERLVGAACAGLAPMFDIDPLPGEDNEQHAERISDAAHVCRNCPVLDSCRIVAAELVRDAIGVWAATEHGAAGRTGRPKKRRTS